jgi:hypothetical protein
MQLSATIANSLWTASNLPGYFRFRRALQESANAQQVKLRELIERNANTAFGKAHGLQAISSYEEFARRVPVSDYATLEPWIARIKRGEANVLTREPVTHLVPTSGSTGARKLIPFTAGLQREFNAAIGSWLADLTRQFPALIGGPAYWSITPTLGSRTQEESAVPVGFDADTSYLGGNRRKLADAVMAVPPQVAGLKSLETFRHQTLLHLLLCRELRLISVWHPSFLTLLLDALPSYWEELITNVEYGTEDTPACSRRATELRATDPFQPEMLWPKLRVVSCWGDAAATFGLEELRRRFPNTFLQPKGLIATEAFVTLPMENRYPLAVVSHFFEFIDESSRVHGVDTLRENAEYEVVVTTAGGLWRYRLGDRVRVTGWLGKTPSLKFLGRGESVSDYFGEKLSEAFVAETLRHVFGSNPPRFALLAPDEDDQGCRYTLYVEGAADSDWARSLEEALRQNPHYSYCRDLQQLLPPRIFKINERGFEAFVHRHTGVGARLGDVKPSLLSRQVGWSEIFHGRYCAATDAIRGGRASGRCDTSARPKNFGHGPCNGVAN